MVVTSVNLMCVWWLLEHWFLHPCLNYYLRCLNYCAYDVCLNCFYGYRSIIRISSLNHSSLSWLITLLLVQLCAWYNFSFFPTPPPPFSSPNESEIFESFKTDHKLSLQGLGGCWCCCICAEAYRVYRSSSSWPWHNKRRPCCSNRKVRGFSLWCLTSLMCKLITKNWKRIVVFHYIKLLF